MSDGNPIRDSSVRFDPLALALALIQSAVPIWGAHVQSERVAQDLGRHTRTDLWVCVGGRAEKLTRLPKFEHVSVFPEGVPRVVRTEMALWERLTRNDGAVAVQQ